METNVLSPHTEWNTTASELETFRPSRALVDYQASDFLKVETVQEARSLKTRLNTEKFLSYTQPDFIAEMWNSPGKTTARIKSLKEIFRRKKYKRFQNEGDLTLNKLPRVGLKRGSIRGENEPTVQPQERTFRGGVGTEYQEEAEKDPKSKLKLRTKIFTRRSQRPSREEEVEDSSRRSASSSIFSDYGQIQASISFASHVRRQGPGFSASCTQTLRTCDFNSLGDLFESEIQSNVTFNPLFEDDDSDDDKPVRPRTHRLYTIDEESEVYDSGP